MNAARWFGVALAALPLAFAPSPVSGQPIKEWGARTPQFEGTHTPVAVEYAGNGAQESYIFVLGEEEHEVGSWFSLTRYSTVPSNPQKDVYIWPPNESAVIHRPVAMAIDDLSDGFGVSIRVFAVGEVILGDGRVRTMTVAWQKNSDGDMAVIWTKEFTRPTDDLEDNIPVGISVMGNLVAVAAHCMEANGTESTFGLNVYHAENGTQWIQPKLLNFMTNETPIGVVMKLVDNQPAAFIVGHGAYGTAPPRFLTVGWDASGNDTGLLMEWDPRPCDQTHPNWGCQNPPCCFNNEHHVRVGLPDIEVRPVKVIPSNDGINGFMVAGNTIDQYGNAQDMFTVHYRLLYSSAVDQGYVNWIHRYDGGTLEPDVARDITHHDYVTHGTEGGTVRTWITGTSVVQGVNHIGTVQYLASDPLEPGINDAYWQGQDEWSAKYLDPQVAESSHGMRINLLRNHFDEPSAGPDGNFNVVIVGFEDDGESPPWHRLLCYNHLLPIGLKTPFWEGVDSAPTGYNSPGVGVDARQIQHNGIFDWRPKFWYSAPTAEDGQQWYTAQHRWPEP